MFGNAKIYKKGELAKNVSGRIPNNRREASHYFEIGALITNR